MTPNKKEMKKPEKKEIDIVSADKMIQELDARKETWNKCCDDWEKYHKQEIAELQNFVEGIADGRAFDKKTGRIWGHWFESAKAISKRLGEQNEI